MDTKKNLSRGLVCWWDAEVHRHGKPLVCCSPEWCEKLQCDQLLVHLGPWARGEYRANIRDYQNMLINQVRWALISHKKDLFQRNGVYWDIVRMGRDESELRGCQGFLKIVNLG